MRCLDNGVSGIVQPPHLVAIGSSLHLVAKPAIFRDSDNSGNGNCSLYKQWRDKWCLDENDKAASSQSDRWLASKAWHIPHLLACRHDYADCDRCPSVHRLSCNGADIVRIPLVHPPIDDNICTPSEHYCFVNIQFCIAPSIPAYACLILRTMPQKLLFGPVYFIGHLW